MIRVSYRTGASAFAGYLGAGPEAWLDLTVKGLLGVGALTGMGAGLSVACCQGRRGGGNDEMEGSVGQSDRFSLH